MSTRRAGGLWPAAVLVVATAAASVIAAPVATPPAASSGVLVVDGDAQAGAPPDTCPGDGSEASPFRSLQCAFESGLLREGTTLRLRDAASPYEGASTAGLMMPRSVTIEPEPGHAPIVVGPLVLSGASDWIIRDLVFDGSGGDAPPGAAIQVVTAGNPISGPSIEGVTIRDWPGHGIELRGSSGEQVTSSSVVGNRIERARDVGIWVQDAPWTRVRNNEISELGCASSTFTLCDECGMDQCAPCGDCLGVQAPECTATSEHGYGGQAGIRVLGESSQVELRGNSIHDFHDDACGADGTRTAGIFITGAGALDGRIERNLIERIAPGNPDNGYGILMFQSASGWTIDHNVLASIGHCGLCEGDPLFYGSRQSRWLRNTVIDVEGPAIDLRWAAEVEIWGTLVADARGGPVRVWPEGTDQAPDLDHNLYWPGEGDALAWGWGDEAASSLPDWQTACGCDAASEHGDPRLRSTPPLDPTPGPTSAAVDLGPLVEGEPFYGEAPDAGALEPTRVLDAGIDVNARSFVRVETNGNLLDVAGCVGFSVEAGGEDWPLRSCSAQAGEILIELVDPAPEGVAATLRYVGRTVMEPAGIGGWLGATLRDFEIAVSNPGGSSSGDTGDTGDDGNGGSTHYDYSGDDDLGYDDGRFGGCDCRGGDAGSRGGPGWALLLLLAWPRRRRPRAPRRG